MVVSRRKELFRAMVREERLRASAGLLGGSDLSSWRGKSGRRYVVGVHALGPAEIADVSESVLIAVHRQQDGGAELVDATACGRELPREWLSRALSRGATEMHVHRLAPGPAERRAVVSDLVGITLN